MAYRPTRLLFSVRTLPITYPETGENKGIPPAPAPPRPETPTEWQVMITKTSGGARIVVKGPDREYVVYWNLHDRRVLNSHDFLALRDEQPDVLLKLSEGKMYARIANMLWED